MKLIKRKDNDSGLVCSYAYCSNGASGRLSTGYYCKRHLSMRSKKGLRRKIRLITDGLRFE